MKKLLIGSLTLALIAGAGVSWAQGNPCEATPDSGGTGCGVPKAVFHSTGVDGGIQVTGSDYDNTCATGANGCTVNQPLMRFWAQDAFDATNSGAANQSNATTEWMINPALDFPGSRPETDVWVFFQANWSNADVQGCVPGGGRTVAEVSWFDTTTNAAWYAVASVPDSGDLFNFDSITGAGGTSGNIIAVTQVPLPMVTGTVEDSPAAGFGTINFDLAAAGVNWYTENGMNDGANQLIAGYEVLYQEAAAAPAEQAYLDSDVGTTWQRIWADAGVTRLGVVAAGAGLSGVVPLPAAGNDIYLTARIVYADAASGCTPGNCSEPDVTVPGSCYGNNAMVSFTPTPVEFSKFDAERTNGNTVVVSWQTTMETDTYGFTLERREQGETAWTQVGGIELARGAGSSYSITDTNAKHNTSYQYLLKEVALEGTPSQIGPITVDAVSNGAGLRNRNF